ncbi:MAG: hypothetical protein WD342_21090, partial [Verrucomicrobiales bacterium]
QKTKWLAVFHSSLFQQSLSRNSPVANRRKASLCFFACRDWIRPPKRSPRLTGMRRAGRFADIVSD